jgi:hypothetical protein
LSGRIELLLVQTGQKGQAGRFRGMFQLPGMFGRAERIAASAVLQILPAFFQGLLRGLADVHQRQQVGPAARAAVGVGVVFSAGWTGQIHGISTPMLHKKDGKGLENHDGY